MTAAAKTRERAKRLKDAPLAQSPQQIRKNKRLFQPITSSDLVTFHLPRFSSSSALGLKGLPSAGVETASRLDRPDAYRYSPIGIGRRVFSGGSSPDVSAIPPIRRRHPTRRVVRSKLSLSLSDRPARQPPAMAFSKMWATPKRRRAEPEEQHVFRPEWTQRYLVVERDDGEGAECLVCRRPIVATRERDVRRHYEAEHEHYEAYAAGGERAALVERLRRGDALAAAALSREERAVRASLGVAHLLALHGRPWGAGGLVRRCLEAVLREALPEHCRLLDEVDLSPESLAQKTLGLARNLHAQLVTRGPAFQAFSLALDDQAFVGTDGRLLVFVRGVDQDYEIDEELLTVVNLAVQPAVGQVLRAIAESMARAGLTWDRLVGVASTGTAWLTAEDCGLVQLLQDRAAEARGGVGGSSPLPHCAGLLHLELMGSRELDVGGVVDAVAGWLALLRTRGARSIGLKMLLEEAELHHGGEVSLLILGSWLRRGKALKRVFSLRRELECFLAEAGVPPNAALRDPLQDPDWLCDMSFLVDMQGHLAELASELRVPGTFAFTVMDHICAFGDKLQLLRAHLSAGDLSLFPASRELCAELDQQGQSGRELLASHRYQEALARLHARLQKQFEDLCAVKRDLDMFADPFSFPVENAPAHIQEELIRMKSSSTLLCEYREENLGSFYAGLPPGCYTELQAVTFRAASLFDSSAISDKAYAYFLKHQGRLCQLGTEEHLHALVRIATSNFEPRLDDLVRARSRSLA
ncbi:EPM2A-interacting protein 1 [Sarcophilus harrisii]|uniref:EPM2A-interacting protein 1 n=1 Tax=Sarcophilus harrisii TaxID=9305 RepID=UPI001301FB6E|nr:EPM2A-interacting protein 1 [Sarcophilus harrisii]